VRDVVITAAVRTPVGRAAGALAELRPDDLAAVALRAADRQAAHVGLEEGLEHVAELLGADDRGDDFHRSPPWSERTRIAPSPLE